VQLASCVHVVTVRIVVTGYAVLYCHIAVYLLFQFEIYSLPQEGDNENAEKSNSHRHGLLEMGREWGLVRDVDNTGVLVSEVLVFEHNFRSAGGIQVCRMGGGRGA